MPSYGSKTRFAIKFTFLHVEESTHCGWEGLDDGEKDKDTDIVAEHPEHEYCHEDLWLWCGCDFEKFLS